MKPLLAITICCDGAACKPQGSICLFALLSFDVTSKSLLPIKTSQATQNTFLSTFTEFEAPFPDSIRGNNPKSHQPGCGLASLS